MDFRFSEAEEAWRKEIKEFFAREVTEEFLDKLTQEQGGWTNPHSQELYVKMADRGWLGLSWPKEYGGQERSYTEQAIFSEEAAKGRCPAGTLNVIGNSVHFLGGLLLASGNENQKKEWLSLIARGQLRSCQGLSEPNAGSDLASVELRAIEKGDEYVLNGTKIYSNAHNTTHIFTVTRTDTEVPKHRGISLLLVDLSSPGITISPLITCGGRRRNEVAFEDVEVPKENMVGDKNQGWYVLATAMGFERTQSIGVAKLESSFAELVKCVKEIKYEGRPLSQIPAVRSALANIATEIQIAWLLSYRVAWLQGQGQSVGAKEAPMAKLSRSEVEERFANTVTDVLGQYGQLEKWGEDKKRIPLHGEAATLYRDSRTDQIAAGTSEVQLNIIAQRGLGLPRAPKK